MAPNILVLSDLHLGEDVKPYSVRYLRHLARLERELEDFLAHHTDSRLDGRPWRLIVNGDMVDFMGVCLLPAPGEGASAEERKFGLASGPAQTQRKLEQVVRRHPGVFRRLAAFVAAGNELVIVVGNHDIEFHFQEVQETFKQALVRLIDETAPVAEGAERAAALRARISFHPWFYYERDFLYVEHGHQYDHYCSFDYILNPVAPQQQGFVVSVANAIVRYFCNRVPDLDPHGQEEWGALGHMRWALGRGVRGFVRVLGCYCLLIWRLLTVWRELRQVSLDSKRRQAHLERLRTLTGRYGLEENTLLRLEALKSPTIMRDFFAIVRMFFLDRVALAMIALLGSLGGALVTPAGWRWVPVLVFVAGVIAVDRALGARQTPGQGMSGVPALIRDLLRVPLVVFGHSHDPVAQALPAGGWYFNTGTWVASERPGLLHAFTHLVIRHDEEGPRAQLYQWRNGSSSAYGPEAPALVAIPATS